jgi:hypothetical protein
VTPAPATAKAPDTTRAAARVEDHAPTPSGAGAFTIAVSGPEGDVRAGSDVPVKIVMTNVSDHQLSFSHSAGRGGPEFVYRFEVKGADGRVMDTTRMDRGRQEGAGSIVEYVQPGRSMVQTANLAKIMRLTRPGRYTVQVSRRDAKNNALVRSNEVVVNIAP